jgi:hypothetical protein
MMKRIFSGAVVSLLIVFAAVVSSSLPGVAQLGQQQTWGGTSTCTGNAQTINVPNLGSMDDLLNVTIGWKVATGCGNTGPATVSVNGTLSQVNIYRMNSGAAIQLGGGEMPAGALVQATWDGAEFILRTDYTNGAPVGSAQIIHSTTADAGYMLENGACFTSTDHPSLATYLGTTYNTQDGCTTGQTGLPDLRGRDPTGSDTMGRSAAGRMPTSIAGTAIGSFGGQAQYASGIAQGFLQNFNMFGSASVSGNITVSGTLNGTVTTSGATGGGGGSMITGASQIGQTAISTSGSLSGGNSMSGSSTVASGGSGTAFPVTAPLQIVFFEIKL